MGARLSSHSDSLELLCQKRRCKTISSEGSNVTAPVTYNGGDYWRTEKVELWRVSSVLTVLISTPTISLVPEKILERVKTVGRNKRVLCRLVHAEVPCLVSAAIITESLSDKIS